MELARTLLNTCSTTKNSCATVTAPDAKTTIRLGSNHRQRHRRRCLFCPGNKAEPTGFNEPVLYIDEGGSAEPTHDKNIIGMYRRRGSNPPLLCDPGWVV